MDAPLDAAAVARSRCGPIALSDRRWPRGPGSKVAQVLGFLLEARRLADEPVGGGVQLGSWTSRVAGALSALLLALSFPLISTAGSAAAASGVTLAASASPTVLFGTPSSITLTATNGGATPVYNLSLRDVLPVGVSYVSGSSAPAILGEPTVIANQPTLGATTLVWPNISDIEPGSTTALTFSVQAESGTNAAADNLLPGNTYADDPSAYVSTDPRYAPAFGNDGSPMTGASIEAIHPPAPGATLITPLEISKAEPSPESKLLRGVHQHPTVYALTVTNSPVAATDAVTVEDWLPAGLEFLGCGGVDNTTNAVGTNAGSALEYPGATHLGVGLTAPQGCSAPTTVETLETTPPGRPAGVYTHVVWNLADLAPGATTTLRYYAGIPLRANAASWAGGTPATTGAQAANLDNNTGPYTFDGESLTNLARVSGDFQGGLAPGTVNPVHADGTDTVVAKDLSVTKSVSTSSFVGGQHFTYALLIRTGEYRYISSPHLTDDLPRGICPIDSATNYTSTDADCAPVAGSDPTLVENDTGASEVLGPTSASYWTVAADGQGGFHLSWPLPELPLGATASPGDLAPNVNATLTFTAADRLSYDDGKGNTTPVVGGDTVTNTSSIGGTSTDTCFSGTAEDPVADPTCTGSSTPITVNDPDRDPSPSAVTDSSSASQSAALPTMIKRIADPSSVGSPANCATAHYITTPIEPYPVYQTGDRICFQLEVDFPLGVDSRNATITDLLPPNTTYEVGSATPVAGPSGNTVTEAFNDSQSASGLLSWKLGDPAPSGNAYAGAGQRFLVDLSVVATADPSSGNTFDLTGNLMKGTVSNTAGKTYSLRSQVNYTLSRPVLHLAKGIVSVARGGSTVLGPFVPPAATATVEAGDFVTYAVDLTNTGFAPAFDAQVLDVLPPQVASCAAVSAISNSGSCSVTGTGTVELRWPSSAGISVPAATSGSPSVPGSTQLTYQMVVPAGIGAGEALTNHAGVVTYGTADNTGSSRTEVPKNNIDSTNYPSSTWNSPAADDTATVTTPAATLAKSAQPKVNGPSSATIGEPIVYTLTATVPAGTTLYGGTLTDALGTVNPQLRYDGGAVKVTANGVSNPAGYTVDASTTTNSVVVHLPATVQAPTSGAIVVTVSFTATVTNSSTNAQGATATNTATLGFSNSQGTASTLSASAATTIVEPNLTLTKTDSPGGPYQAGQQVTYTVTASNPSGQAASTAYNLVITDPVPAGLTVVAGSISAPGVLSTNSTTGQQTITWDFGHASSIAVGGSTSVSFAATIPNPVVAGTSYKNTASGTISSLDPTLYPGARTLGDRYQAAAQNVVAVVSPTVAKSANPTTTTIGVSTTYTATVTLPANLSFPDLTAFDALPNGMTFDRGVTPTLQPSGFTAGACASGYVGSVLAPPVAITGGGTRLGFFLGSLSSCPSVRTVTITYAAYPSKTYASGGAVTAPANLPNAFSVAWNATDTTGGTPPTTVPDPASYQYQVAPVVAPITVIEPKLVLVKTVTTSTPTPGVPFSFTVTVTNSGTSPAYDATLTDPLPQGIVDPLSGPTTSGTNAGTATYTSATRSIRWQVPGPIAPGASVQLTFSTELVASAQLATNQAITNTATVSSYYGVPATIAQATPSRYVTYGPVTGQVTVTATFPGLVLQKTTPSGPAATVNQPFPWKLVLTNSTVAPAATTAIVDTLPPGWTYAAGTAIVTSAAGGSSPVEPQLSTSGGNQVLTWPTTGPLSKGQQISVSFSAVPSTSAPFASTNTARASGTDGTGASGNLSGPYQSNVASATATVVMADLQIVKKAVSNPFIAGGSTNAYTLVVTNNGPSAAQGPITVVDDAPAGMSFTSATGSGWTCLLGQAGASVTCTTPGPLTNGQVAPTITVQAAVPASALGSFTNTATVSSPTYDPNLANNTSSVQVDVVARADLAITKSHQGPVVAGQPVLYTLTVSNLGPSDSPAPGTPVTVTDTLPAGEHFLSAKGAGWSCPSSAAAQQFTCSATTGFTVGSTSQILVEASVDSSVASGTTLTNVAAISQTAITDPNLANNTASDPAQVATSADLSIDKTHDPASQFRPGVSGDGTYRFAVSNAGPSNASNPTVVDTLPPQLTFLAFSPGNDPSWSCAQVTGTQELSCTLNHPLAAGQQAPSIGVEVSVNSNVTSSASIDNTATVTSPTPDPDESNNTSTDLVSSGTSEADLLITKTHAGAFTAGTTGTYHLTVENLGPADVPASSPITATDELPPGLHYVSGGSSPWACSANGSQVTCVDLAGLAAGSTAPPIVLTVAVDPALTPQIVLNQATVSSPVPDPNPTNNEASDPTEIVASADLSVVKTPVGAFTPGTNGTYTLVVSNAGPSDAAEPVTVTDPLPDGQSFVSGTGTGWTCSARGQFVTCTLAGALVPGATAPTLTLTVLVDPGFVGTSMTNVARVDSPTPDDNPPNDTSMVTVPGMSPQADLSIVKSHTGTFVAGEEASFSLVVTNNGPSHNAGGIVVTDPLPSSLQYLSATGTDWQCSEDPSTSTVTCTYAAALPATGANVAPPITITVLVDASTTLTSDVNVASVASTTTVDPNPSNDTSTDPFAVGHEADLSVTKVHTGTLLVGQRSTYTLVASNAGPSDAAAPVRVTDDLPLGLTYESATGSGWSCDATGQSVTCSLAGSLPAGATAAPIALTVTVEASAYPTVTNVATVSSPTPDPDPSNNTARDPGVVEPSVDLAITKTHQGDPLVSVPFDYTIDVVNHGPTPDPGPVQVVDPLPDPLRARKIVVVQGHGWTCQLLHNGAEVRCTGALGLGVGEGASFRLTAVASTTGTVTNVATVSSSATDVDPSNNTAPDPTTIRPAANLTVTKTLLTPTPLRTGGPADYQVVVHNLGPSPATGVTATDQVPAGLSATGASGAGWSCQVSSSLVSCSYGPALGVGADATLVITTTVTATSGTVLNSVVVGSGLPPTTGSGRPSAKTPPAPISNGGLPFTGLNPWPTLLLAGGLLSLGTLSLALDKRRRHAR